MIIAKKKIITIIIVCSFVFKEKDEKKNNTLQYITLHVQIRDIYIYIYIMNNICDVYYVLSIVLFNMILDNT